MLDYAKTNDVDFILLGGDLFDEVNPSKETFLKCINLLKNYVFGSKEVLIGASLNGSNVDFKPNFYDKNINISLPIFTIHGNHDYPSGDFGRVSICDLLHASFYLNYFGRHLNMQNIIIKPIIIEKKNIKTKIALYGLGYIKDHVLN